MHLEICNVTAVTIITSKYSRYRNEPNGSTRSVFYHFAREFESSRTQYACTNGLLPSNFCRLAGMNFTFEWHTLTVSFLAARPESSVASFKIMATPRVRKGQDNSVL